jgi:hypothetical protein
MAGCLAGFIGQWTAFGATTNSVWDLNSINILKVGKLQASATNAATAVFLSDGTCSLLVGTNEFDGTYTNNTKQLALTFDATALKSNAVDFVLTLVPPGAATITVKSLKINKITLKNGIPTKAGDSVKASVSAVVKGKTKSKGISITTLWSDWTLSSGTTF